MDYPDLFDIRYLTKDDFDKHADKHEDSVWEGDGYYDLGCVDLDSFSANSWQIVITPLAKRIEEVEDIISNYIEQLESVKKTYSKTLKETEIREQLRRARLEVSKLEEELEKLNDS